MLEGLPPHRPTHVLRLLTDEGSARAMTDILGEMFDPTETAVAAFEAEDGTTWRLEAYFADAPDEALRRIDAWLCDLKDFAIKDGLHIYGRAEADDEPIRQDSAAAERGALIAALDGRHGGAGPSGSM